MGDDIKKRAGVGLRSIFNQSNKALFDDVNNNIFDLNNAHKVKISIIKPNPYQPRKGFSEIKLKELATSIKKDGLIQPILINMNNYIIVGERRFLAVKKLGWEMIPSIRIDVNEKDLATIALAENLIRENINPIEEALGYQRLIKKFGYTQNEIAEQFGKSRTYITNTLRLLKLPKKVINMLINKEISAGHARVLLQLKDNKVIIEKAQQIIKQNIPVNKVIKTKKKLKTEKVIESYFNKKLKCVVSIKNTTIVLKFKTNVDLESFKKTLK